MTNRREFLQIGLAATALPLGASAVSLVTPLGSAPPAETVTLYKALYDTRFPASVAFAERLAARGTPVAAMTGDMTRFWYDDLYHRWKKGPAAIAGLTAHGALFCLAELAAAERMRVMFRARHLPSAGGSVRHEFEGPAGLVGLAQQVAAGADWAAAMADVVSQCSRARAKTGTASALTVASVLPTPGSEPLFSWVIAPAARS